MLPLFLSSISCRDLSAIPFKKKRGLIAALKKTFQNEMMSSTNTRPCHSVRCFRDVAHSSFAEQQHKQFQVKVIRCADIHWESQDEPMASSGSAEFLVSSASLDEVAECRKRNRPCNTQWSRDGGAGWHVMFIFRHEVATSDVSSHTAQKNSYVEVGTASNGKQTKALNKLNKR